MAAYLKQRFWPTEEDLKGVLVKTYQLGNLLQPKNKPVYKWPKRYLGWKRASRD